MFLHQQKSYKESCSDMETNVCTTKKMEKNKDF